VRSKRFIVVVRRVGVLIRRSAVDFSGQGCALCALKRMRACASRKIFEVWQMTRIDILRGMSMNADDVIADGVAYSRLT
jgi:hypothetical protein